MFSKVVRLSLSTLLLGPALLGQSPQPYPHAATDRGIHPKTAMVPPPVNMPFYDPDFGSLMVRVTDESTNPSGSTTYEPTPAGNDEWSLDGRKLFVRTGGGKVLAFGFDPSTMTIFGLGGSPTGQGFRVPLGAAPTFSRADPDLIYGTFPKTPLTIGSYRFSSNNTSTIIDTTTCATVPALVAGPGVLSDYDFNLADNDARMSISEGGNEFGHHMFAIVYDKKLGCRWYNTQTGEVGGKWGASGTVSIADRYLIRHAALSRNGRYLRIAIDGPGAFYVWDIDTLKVTSCPAQGDLHCDGYSANGYNSMSGRSDWMGDWNIVKRSFGDLGHVTPLVWPLTPLMWGQEKHFSWNADNPQDTGPLCGAAFSYYSNDVIDRSYEGEIFCLATDGVDSIIWRFAHHRSAADEDEWNTQPVVNTTRDGRFLLFNSNWDKQLGFRKNGVPRSDIWIVKLE